MRVTTFAAGERGVDRRGLFGLPECDRVGGSRGVEPIDSAEVEENASDREVAHLCPGVAGLDRYLLAAPVDRDNELGKRFLRCGGGALGTMEGPDGPGV